MKTDSLKQLLGVSSLSIRPVPDGRLPMLLSSLYSVQNVCAGDRDFVLLADKGGEPLSVKTVAKHCAWARDLLGKEVVFAADDLAAYKRNRLRRTGVPFHVPGRETFLPFLGVASRAVGRATRPRRPDAPPLGAAAAHLVVAGLSGCFPDGLDLDAAQRLLGRSHVTALAAFDELERFGLALRTARPSGHGKILSWLQPPRERWAKAEPALPGPVRAIVGLDALPRGPSFVPAGESALAARTSLAPPPQPVVAVHARGGDLTALKRAAVPVEDAAFRVELWNRPVLLPGRSEIDPFSLLLSTRGSNDERVEGAREELLEDIRW